MQEVAGANPTRRVSVRSGIAAAAWIALTVAFVEPLNALMLNWEELTISFPTMFRRLAPIALVVFAGLAPMALATCWAAPTRALALWTACCVALCAQGDLFVWNYGTFDGAPLDWSAHRGKAWLESAVWLGAPALALWRPSWTAKRALGVLVALTAFQGSGLAIAAFENAPFAQRPAISTRASTRASEFMTLSSKHNAIIVVLDMVQSDFFAEAMRSDELAARMPAGFIYYRNAISLYVSTQFSIQSVLTSRAVPDGKDALRWRKSALEHSLPVVLHEQGFDAKLVTFFGPSISCEGSMPGGPPCARLRDLRGPNLATASETAWRTDSSLLLRLGLFRLAPHWLKARIYDAGVWGIPEAYPTQPARGLLSGISAAVRIDLEVLDNLTEAVRGEDVAPRFRFMHFNGAHLPAAIDARCEGAAMGSERERSVATTRCMLRKLYQFFDALEEAQVYDPSVIVVVSDHGHPWLAVDLAAADPPLPKSTTAASGALGSWSRGVPLFLVKLPGARGPLQTSDRPVSLCDVPATVLDALDLEHLGNFECETVLGATRREPRLHYRYPEYAAQKQRPRRTRYRFEFDRFRVEGHSWYPASWIREAVPTPPSTH